MRVITIASQKGGSGKTTLALHLAAEAERSGETAVIVDLDPQASATGWKDSRDGDTPAVVSIAPARLEQALQMAREHGANLVLVDTAPQVESPTLAAARLSDLVLVPCRPAILDLRAIGATLDIARLAKKPAAVVLNAVPARGSLVAEAIEAIAAYDVLVAPVHLGQRAAFVHALTAGQVAQEYEPGGKAAEEVSRLYMWTRTYYHI
jgi:chromosome partitioning protein